MIEHTKASILCKIYYQELMFLLIWNALTLYGLKPLMATINVDRTLSVRIISRTYKIVMKENSELTAI